MKFYAFLQPDQYQHSNTDDHQLAMNQRRFSYNNQKYYYYYFRYVHPIVFIVSMYAIDVYCLYAMYRTIFSVQGSKRILEFVQTFGVIIVTLILVPWNIKKRRDYRESLNKLIQLERRMETDFDVDFQKSSPNITKRCFFVHLTLFFSVTLSDAIDPTQAEAIDKFNSCPLSLVYFLMMTMHVRTESTLYAIEYYFEMLNDLLKERSTTLSVIPAICTFPNYHHYQRNGRQVNRIKDNCNSNNRNNFGMSVWKLKNLLNTYTDFLDATEDTIGLMSPTILCLAVCYLLPFVGNSYKLVSITINGRQAATIDDPTNIVIHQLRTIYRLCLLLYIICSVIRPAVKVVRQVSDSLVLIYNFAYRRH